MFEHKTPCMDNFKVHVVSRCMPHLVTAMKLCFEDCAGPNEKGSDTRVVTHFKKTEFSLALKWHYQKGDDCGFVELPFPMDIDAAVAFAVAFLQSANYGPQPDHDGSNTAGFKVTSGSDSVWSGRLCVIEPTWAMHGK